MKVAVPEELLPADRLGHVHFVGIGGAGLSAIARIMLARGLPVSGSDGVDSPTLDALRALGARVHVGHAADQLGDADTVVVSTAVREDNPEYVEAVVRGLRVLPRSAALASVMAGRRVVAVAGTHGKTTTTSLLTVALQAAGADPTYAIGGDLAATGGNAAEGTGELLRRRGRRERRRVPALRAVRRDRHQRRGRPPRPLGDRGGLRRAFDEFAATSTRTGSWSAASTTRAPRRWPSVQRAAGLRVVTVSTRPGVADVGPEALGGRDAVVARGALPGRRAAGLGRRRRSWASTPTPTCAAGSRPTPAPGAGWSARARPAAYGSTTATPTTRPRSPGTWRRRGRWRATAGWSWPSSRTWSPAPAPSAPRWARRSAPPTRSWSATSTWPARTPTPR